MKKSIINKCLIGIGILSMASCSDPMEEITDVIYAREFSPTKLEVKNVKETVALLTWNASTRISGYSVEVYADDSLSFTSSPFITKDITTNELLLELVTKSVLNFIMCSPISFYGLLNRIIRFRA